MTTTISRRRDATIEDLSRITEKAELVNGEIIIMPPTGDEPGYAAGITYINLHGHAKKTGEGRAVGDSVGFLANLRHRKSFSPDAAYYVGPRGGMKFFPLPPVFAVEVRSENDYGAPAEITIAQKRADYFAAGTLVVWDVDLLSADVVKSYRADDPQNPRVFRRRDIADAEPAVPGWTMPVDDLFDE